MLKGEFCIDLEGIRTTKAKLQGKNATSASVFVPKDWAGKDVIVLLARKEVLPLKPQKIQIIKRRVDTRRLNGEYGDEGRYYQEVKHAIKRDIKHEADLLLIDLVPKEPITNICTLEVLLHLQGEFTNHLIIPKNMADITERQITEITDFLNAKNVLFGV